ncbi:suppressor of cytokine signaling 1b [Hemibagrus wyckioides]|uniref:suppressor of cytokine signaling 1b n=1 Tax=Hemibagrus wyckioides TaxID=337641 RepID=UPI00266C05EF|nr:suppressor of cytokine signaling 1b [Hemibagrus wyckioides]XP_058236572.1 suppressor of cytokine signaling 1b [Hemibagrus wyckioides]
MVHHNEPPEPSAPKPDPISVALTTHIPAPQTHPAASTRPAPPTHFRPFRDVDERSLVASTTRFLGNSGFYWGPLDVDEAHARLTTLPVGTFLIRDSMQTDVFFTLSYHSEDGPTSVRVLLKGCGFALDGSKHAFPCLFELLRFYMTSAKRSLKQPYRGSAPQKLQELCRRAVVKTYGKDNLDKLPVTSVLRDFLQSYPFSI